MLCTTAQLDMHRRLDADGLDAKRGFADLDAHLASCPACARAWLELLTARQRLGTLRTDAPTPEEIESMWQAIAVTAPLELPAFRPPARAVILRFVGASAAVAACLFIAFMIGQRRFQANRINAARDAYVTANLQPLADAGLSYASDDPDEHAVPLTPRGTEAWTVQSLKSLDDASPPGGTPEAEVVSADVQPDPSTKLSPMVRARDIAAERAKYDLLANGVGASGVSLRVTENDPAAPADHIANSDADFYADRHELFRNTVLGKSPETVKSGTEYWAYGVYGAATEGDFTADYAVERAGTQLDDLKNTSRPPGLVASTETAGKPSLRQPADGTAQTAGRGLFLQLGSSALSSSDADALRSADVSVQMQGDKVIIKGMGDDAVALKQTLDQVAELHEERPAWDAHASTQLADARGGEGRQDAPQTDTAPEQPGGNVQAHGGLVPAPAARPASTKIIKTGTLATEVDDYEQAVQQVNVILERFDCYLADASTKEMAGGALIGEIVVRVSPAHFEPLFAALRLVGRIASEDVKSADVTAQYVDTEARIAALKITEERLTELVKSKSFVDRMDDLLKVEQEMNRVRTEIEQHEGQLRVLADRVSLSTITMQLREPGRIVPSASLSVEVPVLESAAAALNAALVELDGRLVSGKISQRDKGALAGEYRIQVNLNRFGDALTAIAALGRVESRDVRDWQEQSAAAKWAARVTCDIALVLFERTRDLPAGALTLQIADLPATLQQLDAVLPPAGAAIAGNHTTQRDDGSRSADVQIRVPAGAFADLVARVESLGRVVAKQLTGETGAIAGGSADTPCTLALTLSEPQRQIPSGGMVIEVDAFAPARDRLAELVTKHNIQVLDSNSSQRTDGTWVGRFHLGIAASAIDTAVADLERIGKVSSREIRGIGLGELSRIDKNALGVIEVILAEKAALAPEPNRAGESFRRYLRDGLAGLYGSLGMIVYGLVVMAPWLIIALLAGWLITRAWKRRKAKSAT